MKNLLVALSAGMMFLTTNAQELPQPSPSATIKQRVGLTDISIEYSRPSRKERVIFGELVPYDKVWRFGANKNTMIEISNELSIGDSKLPAGKYSIFAIPTKDEWKISFNKDIEQWGAGNYDDTKDVASIKVKNSGEALTETMTITISDITNTSGVISMTWEKVKIDIPFIVDTEAHAQKNIEEALKKGEDLDKVHYNAARYYHASLKDHKKAMEHIEKSIEIKKSFRNLFTKAQILAATGKNSDAVKIGDEAVKLCMDADEKGWAEYIQSNIDKWKLN